MATFDNPAIDHDVHLKDAASKKAGTKTASASDAAGVAGRGTKVRAMLRARLGEEVYTSWFNALEFDRYDGRVVTVSVPVNFLRNWIQSHYLDALLACCRSEFDGAERVDVVWRQPAANHQRAKIETRDVQTSQDMVPAVYESLTSTSETRPMPRAVPSSTGRTQVGGFEGSPLDPRYTFDSFVIGTSNRMAHAGATQVAEMVMSGSPAFNPLYIHSSVGLGKTHLLHAIAWEVKRRAPHAQVLYLTAERFRYQFVEAVRGQDASAFKEKFRNVHMLLIDDLEFMQGERTEQEFDHIINSLLDGGRQVVVASARAPNQIERLNERMRSRLQRGLVTELGGLDYDLRLKVLERRLAERRAIDSSFELSMKFSNCSPIVLRKAAVNLRAQLPACTPPGSTCARRFRSISPKPSSATSSRASNRAASRSKTSCASCRATSASRKATCFRSAVTARSYGRVKSACIWPSR